MRRLKSYLFLCRFPFMRTVVFSDLGKCKMEPALTSAPGNSYVLSCSAFKKLWYDMNAGKVPELTRDVQKLLMMGYSNFPAFLKEFCGLYYGGDMTLEATAEAMRVSVQLAKQRRVVSISLFRILLASKPKNPV